jgi:two-component system cell cycle response regulator
MTVPPDKADSEAAGLEQDIDVSEASLEQNAGPPARILVVDDDEGVCSFLRRVLANEGYAVDTCLNGRDALAKLKDESFQVVIADLKMPDVDGLEVLKNAKKLDPLCQVVMVTAYASVESAVEAMRLGAHDYINKPFNVDEITVVVDKALEKRALLQAREERDFYRYLALTDGLTEIYNYRAFHEMLDAELARSQRHHHNLSLLMVDVDGLKIYNDTLGHLAADAVLKELAWTLKKLVRNCDVVARYGGDEFAIILVETDKEHAVSTADRLRRHVEETRFEQDHVFPHKTLTISVGVANYPIDALDVQQLVSKADMALCEAKVLGGNLVNVTKS